MMTFSDFLASAPGRLLRRWEAERFDEAVDDLPSNAALQVGAAQLDTLRANRAALQIRVDDASSVTTPAGRDDLKDVAALAHALPFEADRFSCVTLVHALDFSPHPQLALREAVRVLEPEGTLLLTGFNPYGAWWLRQQAVRLGARAYLPDNTAPLSVGRLQDWLSLLGLRIRAGRFGIYRPACQTLKALASWKWIDLAGDRWAPQCGNLYFLSAVKSVPGCITPGLSDTNTCERLPPKHRYATGSVHHTKNSDT